MSATLEAILGELLRPHAVGTIVSTSVALEELHEAERACVTRAVPKRRGEFAMGRAAAHRVLSILGRDGGPLLPGPDRAPIWPPGVVGSIAHGGGVAGAVAALASNHHGVGLDLEAATSVEAAVWSRITTDDERAELAAIDPATAGFRGKLLFSAKESVFKAVYPATGVHLYFRDCRIRLDPPPDGEGDTRGRFTAALTRAELPEELRTRSLVGGYAVVAGVILTSLTWPVR